MPTGSQDVVLCCLQSTRSSGGTGLRPRTVCHARKLWGKLAPNLKAVSKCLTMQPTCISCSNGTHHVELDQAQAMIHLVGLVFCKLDGLDYLFTVYRANSHWMTPWNIKVRGWRFCCCYWPMAQTRMRFICRYGCRSNDFLIHFILWTFSFNQLSFWQSLPFYQFSSWQVSLALGRASWRTCAWPSDQLSGGRGSSSQAQESKHLPPQKHIYLYIYAYMCVCMRS